MAKLYSNELRAVVFPNNFQESAAGVLKENCLTVQHFDYQCEHKRNESGEVYGATEPVILKFTIRVNSPRLWCYRTCNTEVYDSCQFTPSCQGVLSASHAEWALRVLFAL